MTKQEAIQHMKESRNIQDWNFRREEVLTELNLKKGLQIDIDNPDFRWFMQNIDCNGLLYKTMKKNNPYYNINLKKKENENAE